MFTNSATFSDSEAMGLYGAIQICRPRPTLLLHSLMITAYTGIRIFQLCNTDHSSIILADGSNCQLGQECPILRSFWP